MQQSVSLGLTLALSLAASVAVAQPSTVHRTTLQTQAFPAAPLHTLTARVLVDPGGAVAPHTHPGLEMGYLIGGQGLLTIGADAPRALVAGDSFAIPPGAVHSLKNTGPGLLTVVSTYVVDETKPIASPAP